MYFQEIGPCRALWFPEVYSFQRTNSKCQKNRNIQFLVCHCLQATLCNRTNTAIFRSKMSACAKNWVQEDTQIIRGSTLAIVLPFPIYETGMKMSSYLCSLKINYYLWKIINILGRLYCRSMKKISNTLSIVGLNFCTVPPPEYEERHISIFSLILLAITSPNESGSSQKNKTIHVPVTNCCMHSGRLQQGYVNCPSSGTTQLLNSWPSTSRVLLIYF